jgi:hypothetical protein
MITQFNSRLVRAAMGQAAIPRDASQIQTSPFAGDDGRSHRGGVTPALQQFQFTPGPALFHPDFPICVAK